MLGSYSVFADVNYYISPTGNDFTGDGSSTAPWKTLYKARDAVRTISRPLTEKINIILKDGTYELTSPLNLTADDSGNKDFKVTYKAENSGQVTISGGTVIKGWSDANNDGIWQASVPKNSDSRQLYVDNQRAIRARSIDGNGWFRNYNGYSAPSEASSWSNQNDVELVFTYRWKMYRGGVSYINGGQATLDEPFFTASALGPFGLVDQNAGVAWVENNLALLDTEGEWYLDKSASTLYYKPKTNENLTGSSAVTVVLPKLQTLISGNNLNYVEFEGLQFSHSTWLKPNRAMGYLSVQSGVHMIDTNYITIEDAFEGIEGIPGSLNFKYSTNIVFRHNSFKHIGSTGLEFNSGSQNNTIFNNIFSDLSASAISIGNAQEHHVKNEIDEVKDHLIDNNLIEFIGREYQDTSGINSIWASRTVIINNQIHNTPYSGISVGWGWGRYDVDQFAFTSDNTGKAYNTETQQKETLVLKNVVDEPMQVLHDGGGIYNLSANPNSRISGNVITGAHDLNGAIYLDDGSRGFQVNDNVSYNNRGPRVNQHIKGAQFHRLHNNDWSGSNRHYKDNFREIVNNAGRLETPTQRTIQNIITALPSALPLPHGTIPPTDGLVIGKIATASTNSTQARQAIDGNVSTYWDAGRGNNAGWLSVDLGKQHNINGVNVAFGKFDENGEYEYIRKGITFEIETSIDGNNFTKRKFFSGTGVENISTPSIIPKKTFFTSKQAINDVLLENNPKARYVRVNITDANNQHFGILRLKVKGDEVPGVNIAPQGKASQSSTWNDNVASRAIDGNTSGDWNAGQITHTNKGSQNYWTLDLGVVRDISVIKIWNRSDCCSERLRNFHVFVSDSPFNGITVAASQAQPGVFDNYIEGIAGATTNVSVNRTGRYVRIQLADTDATSTDNVLSLAEVEVFTPSVNLALQGKASQSSTWNQSVASRAIDDNTGGNWHSEEVTHTDLGSQNYWDLDLGAIKSINSIKIWNRTDCCSNRLTNFHVFVSNNPFTGATVADSKGQTGVFEYYNVDAASTTTNIPVNRTGRYVRIQLENTDANSGDNVLSLAEVQVFGQ